MTLADFIQAWTLADGARWRQLQTPAFLDFTAQRQIAARARAELSAEDYARFYADTYAKRPHFMAAAYPDGVKPPD